MGALRIDAKEHLDLKDLWHVERDLQERYRRGIPREADETEGAHRARLAEFKALQKNLLALVRMAISEMEAHGNN